MRIKFKCLLDLCNADRDRMFDLVIDNWTRNINVNYTNVKQLLVQCDIKTAVDLIKIGTNSADTYKAYRHGRTETPSDPRAKTLSGPPPWAQFCRGK